MLRLNVIPHIPDLTKLTVVEIKAWAKANGLRAPALKKAELIQYLVGVWQTKDAPEHKPIVSSLHLLQPRCHDNTLDWITHLHTHGWAVAPIPGWDPNFVTTFFKWFESCSPNFKANDYTTWKTANMPVLLHGILKHYFGHTEMQWKIRELCLPIFQQIWNCQDLLCSFDGGCFLPCKDKTQNNSFKQWIHCDQFRSSTEFACVQGIVNFVENGPEDGGLVLVEGSHKVFADYMARHPSEGITWGPAVMSDPDLSQRNLIKICAPPGHIILFDSRTFHCNVHPYGNLLRPDGSPRFRMCTYVSMQPRSGATSQELTKRCKLYEKGRMSGHWCFGKWFKETSEHPRVFGGHNNRPEIIEIAELNEVRSKMIGY